MAWLFCLHYLAAGVPNFSLTIKSEFTKKFLSCTLRRQAYGERPISVKGQERLHRRLLHLNLKYIIIYRYCHSVYEASASRLTILTCTKVSRWAET